MALRELLRTLLRRWYVLVVVLVCGAFLIAHFAAEGAVFSTRTAVTFRYAESGELDRYNGTADKSVISFVATIAQEVNGGLPPTTYSSDAAPLYGAGIRQGVQVDVLNEGNQWFPINRKAEIDIQIVGPTHEWVEAKQQSLLGDIARTTQERQEQAGVPVEARIVGNTVPLTLQIIRIAPNRSAQLVAVVGVGVASLLVGGWGAVMLDRMIMSRRRRRARRQAAVAEPEGVAA